MSTALIHSGATTNTSALVAGRVDASASVRLAVSTNSGLSSPTYFGPASADADGYVKVSATGLIAGTTYYAGFEINSVLDTDRKARFKTHAAAPGDVLSFTVAGSSCSPGTGNPVSTHPVFTKIKDRDPLLFIHMGDQNYGNNDSTNPADYQTSIESELTSSTSRGLYEAVPWAWTWDDHDFGDNDSNSTNPGKDTVAAVYRQMIPHFPLEEGTGAIHHAFTIGRVRFIVTDQRYYRTAFGTPDGPAKTILGSTQKAWFKQELLDARDNEDIVLTVWVSSQVPHVGNGTQENWSAYVTERAELWNFFADNQITDLIVWSGDVHASGFKRDVDYSAAQTAPINVYVSSALDNVAGTTIQYADWDGIAGGGGRYATLAFTDHGTHMDVAFQSYRVEAAGNERTEMSDTFTVGEQPLSGIYAVRDSEGIRRHVRDESGTPRYVIA